MSFVLVMLIAAVPIEPPASASAPFLALKLEAIEAGPGRSPEEIFAALHVAETDVATCLQASVITMSATATITVEPSGLVSRVDASADATLAACLRARLLAVRFNP